MNMPTVPVVYALWSLLTAIVVAVISVWQFRKISREEYKEERSHWQDVATRRAERVKNLEDEMANLTEKIAVLRHDQDTWVRRNAQLYSYARDIRAVLEHPEIRAVLQRLGHDPPELPEGL